MRGSLGVGAASATLALPIAGRAQAEDAAGGHDAIIVTGARVQEFRPGALRADIERTEVITAKSIEASNAINVNQSVDKNPGISAQPIARTGPYASHILAGWMKYARKKQQRNVLEGRPTEMVHAVRDDNLNRRLVSPNATATVRSMPVMFE